MVYRRFERTKSFYLHEQDPFGGECKDFYRTSKKIESNNERSFQKRSTEMVECRCGPYPIQEPALLTINRKKFVDFLALKNPSLVRNGCVWSHHLLFIFIYYGENQVRTKNPSLTPIRKKRSMKTRFMGSGIRLPTGKVPHMRKHPYRP